MPLPDVQVHDSNGTGRKQVRPFTGYHMAAIIVAFFAVVVVVNITMARFAISTFSGTVVDNSYVASQKYNGWLERARQEQQQGWAISVPERDGGHLTLSAKDALGRPLSGAVIIIRAEHPIGREKPHEWAMTETSPGIWRSNEVAPAGRWKLRVQVRHGDRLHHMASEIF